MITTIFRDELGVVFHFTADVLSSFGVLFTSAWRTVSKIDSAVLAVVFRHVIWLGKIIKNCKFDLNMHSFMLYCRIIILIYSVRANLGTNLHTRTYYPYTVRRQSYIVEKPYVLEHSRI